MLRRTFNTRRWSPKDKAALRLQLQRLTNMSPYLLVLALPGSILLLPALVWWQARKRNHLLAAASSEKKAGSLGAGQTAQNV